MNSESLENQSIEGGDDMAVSIKQELDEISETMRKLHEGTNELSRSQRGGVRFGDVFTITRDHPRFGEFLREGDEILHLNDLERDELEVIEQHFIDEESSAEERTLLFKRYFDYLTTKKKIIPGKNRSLH